MRLDGVLLAGGASRRFGSDKRMATLAGQPLLLTCYQSLAAAVSGTVYIADGGRPPSVWPAGAVRVADECAGAGPLAGITAALGRCRGPGLLVLAADLPLARSSTLSRLARAGVGSGRAVAVRGRRGWEPLLAYYPRAALQQLRSGLREGPRALHLWLDKLGALALDGTGAAEIANVNRPGDLERIVRGDRVTGDDSQV